MAFSGPIWVVIFSILFLGEKIKAKRWIAVGLGVYRSSCNFKTWI